MAVCEMPAAALVAAGAPDTLNHTASAAGAAPAAAFILLVVIVRQAKGLNFAAGQADCEQRLGRVQDLSKQIR